MNTATTTTYSPKETNRRTQEILRDLHKSGYVAKVGHRKGWRLTAEGYTLLFPSPHPVNRAAGGPGGGGESEQAQAPRPPP